MIQVQQPANKIAISLSVLCAIHCFATPMLMVFLPSLASFLIEPELLHMWLAVGVLPISVFALTLGCKKHRKLQVLALGFIGLAFMLTAVASGALGLGENAEKALTLLGATLISGAHFWNYRLCQQHKKSCDCH
jgi:hypothetical protein